jgi:hypothetical protein
MFPALYKHCFGIFYSIVVCVDFLGTHMTSLVLFFGKSGVTEWYQSGVDCRTYAKIELVGF